MAKDTDINGHRTDTSKATNVKSTTSNVNNTGQSSEKDEMVQNEEILEYDEDKDDTMYKQSVFYKRFQQLTFQGNYDNTEKTQLNNFYCPDYLNLLLKKYIPILPLWTCLNSEKRMSNSNSENLFGVKKSISLKTKTLLVKCH